MVQHGNQAALAGMLAEVPDYFAAAQSRVIVNRTARVVREIAQRLGPDGVAGLRHAAQIAPHRLPAPGLDVALNGPVGAHRGGQNQHNRREVGDTHNRRSTLANAWRSEGLQHSPQAVHTAHDPHRGHRPRIPSKDEVGAEGQIEGVSSQKRIDQQGLGVPLAEGRDHTGQGQQNRQAGDGVAIPEGLKPGSISAVCGAQRREDREEAPSHQHHLRHRRQPPKLREHTRVAQGLRHNRVGNRAAIVQKGEDEPRPIEHQ